MVWFVVGADECVALGGVVLSQAGFWQTLGGSGLKLAGAGVGFSRVLCRHNVQTQAQLDCGPAELLRLDCGLLVGPTRQPPRWACRLGCTAGRSAAVAAAW